jgi:hypothetical protein
VALLKGAFGDVVSELTGQLVVSRTGVLVVLSNGPASGDGELASEAVAHLGVDVPPLGGEVDVGGVIGAGPWHLVEVGLGASADLAEVAHAAVLVLGEEVVALIVDAEGHGVGTRTRHLHPLPVLLVGLPRQAVRRFRQRGSNLIGSGTWVLVDLDGSERASGFHLLASLPKAKAGGLIGGEASADVVGIGGWVLGCTAWGGGYSCVKSYLWPMPREVVRQELTVEGMS